MARGSPRPERVGHAREMGLDHAYDVRRPRRHRVHDSLSTYIRTLTTDPGGPIKMPLGWLNTGS
jgi:hypothetical protein